MELYRIQGIVLACYLHHRQKGANPLLAGIIKSFVRDMNDEGMRPRQNVRIFSLSILGPLYDALEVRYPFLSGDS